tara:strand:- start:241 stop:1140 length:900 start_codon:yes stop_codon:yes gene_type:complete
MSFIKLFLILPMFFIMGCSAAYEKVKDLDTANPKTFKQYLLFNYQKNASFEAEEMHDWNSAKLYSEKALKALNGENIYPEQITNWNLSKEKATDISLGYNNLLSVYDEAIINDPKNLAKAISSLDCWAEQEEEKWQTWDIEKCKNDFHMAMHKIYKNLSNKSNLKENKKENQKKDGIKNNITIVTQNEKEEVMQIIYFDFDDFSLSEVSKTTLTNFLNKNKIDLSRYIIIGHTDTKGTSNYNLKLSMQRAEAIKNILVSIGISEKNISVLGKGEGNLAVYTPDDTKHPANRRAEIKILN